MRTTILDDEQIVSFFALEEVQAAKQKIDAQSSGSVYFTVGMTDTIRAVLQESFGLTLPSAAAVPMRWIKGDIKNHVDVGTAAFDTTHLLYLTDSPGELMVDGESHPITKGSAYSFPESSRHETINTGSEPRLLLGPMSEEGFAVGGGSNITGAGGTIVYIRQNSGTYEYSYDRTIWNQYNAPTTVTNTNTATGIFTVEFMTDMYFPTIFNYFICGSSHIQFGSSSLKTDGSRPVITIDGVTDAPYPGLIQNGYEFGPGYSDIYVFNLVVDSSGSTLATGGGWIGQEYFGREGADNYIINCSSKGPISDNGGGIVGSSAGSEAGASLTLTGCSSSGIIGPSGGGIVGILAGANSGSVTCESCWSTGLIGGDSGGIMGPGGAFATISNCYSTGAISTNGGGICGSSCAVFSRIVTITNSYSTGSMGGASSGGIVGYQAGTVVITNCYSLGSMASPTSGGIIGAPLGAGLKTITYCYTVGSVTGGLGYITGSSATVSGTCFSEAKTGTPGTWNSANASTYLQEVPNPIIGLTWIDVSAGSPYELFNMGYSPYTIANITATPRLTRSFSALVAAGASTASAVQSGKSYTLLDVSGGAGPIIMNAVTGVISTTDATAPGAYTIYLRNTGSYNITEYQLTVTEGGGGTCCDRPTFKLGPGVGYDTYTDIRVGNILIETVQRRPLSYDQLMTIRKAQASKKNV